MRQCIRCKHVKFWFQFYSEFCGLWTTTYDICKKCAGELAGAAVHAYWEQHGRDQFQRGLTSHHRV